jgi:hypothetical protein
VTRRKSKVHRVGRRRACKRCGVELADTEGRTCLRCVLALDQPKKMTGS